MSVRTLITGGGTGGHVYPALSIIRHLHDRAHQLESGSSAANPSSENTSSDDSLIYVGSSRGLERLLVARTGIRCFLFPMAPPNSLRGVLLLGLATLRSLTVLLRARPRVTFATGGFVSFPAAVASWMLRIPVVLFLPDVVPGKAVAWLVPLAHRIAVSTEDARQRLPLGKTVVTGYPVREWFSGATKREARSRLGLPADATVVCVFGGSQGARSINRALARCLPELLARSHVLHICGERRFDETTAATTGLSSEQRARYHLFPYLHDRDMADALAAADLAVSRSGASTLGELPAVGTPAILVPFPDPAVHQRENAAYLAEHGAAVVIPDDELADQLGAVLERILDSPDCLTHMADACRALAHPQAATAIASLLAEVAA